MVPLLRAWLHVVRLSIDVAAPQAAAGGVMCWRRRGALRPAGLPSVSGALRGTLGTMATTRGDGGGGRDLGRAMLTDAYEAVPT
jgi:hypothetical protein